MLHEFLEKYRTEVLALTEEKSLTIAGTRDNSKQLQQGLPLFYDQLIRVLLQKQNSNPTEELLKAAAEHGREFLHLGYSLSHVVHAYGAMCQAITELATRKNADISPAEFNVLNGCLDVAIASAVSEYQFRSVQASEAKEIKHLGFLAHELRNALSSATIAQEMIKAGLVGTGGSTARVLEANLSRMRHLIDRSLSEVRMRADSDVFVEKFRLSDLLDQIVVTARIDSDKKQQTLNIEADWKIEIEADRQFILSAIANLVQNAIKYSKTAGKIVLRAQAVGDRVSIEVQDECGGLEPGKIDTLFEPYVKVHAERSGLGLGLTITQRAVHLSQGTISVRNNPGCGCTFVVDIPKVLVPDRSGKITVEGVKSVQPNFPKKQ